jgi:hypothetical protein
MECGDDRNAELHYALRAALDWLEPCDGRLRAESLPGAICQACAHGPETDVHVTGINGPLSQ